MPSKLPPQGMQIIETKRFVWNVVRRWIWMGEKYWYCWLNKFCLPLHTGWRWALSSQIAYQRLVWWRYPVGLWYNGNWLHCSQATLSSRVISTALKQAYVEVWKEGVVAECWGHEDLYLFMRWHNVCQKQNNELTPGLRRKWWRLMGVGNDNLEPFSSHSKSYHHEERSAVIKWRFLLWTVHWGVRSMAMHMQAVGGTWAFIPELNCQAQKRRFSWDEHLCLLASHKWWLQRFKVFHASAGFFSCLVFLKESCENDRCHFVSELGATVKMCPQAAFVSVLVCLKATLQHKHHLHVWNYAYLYFYNHKCPFDNW